jgi:hypothetical protein
MSHVLRVINEISKKTLYIKRTLQNVDDLTAWAKANGFKNLDDMHVTVAFSRTPIDWDKIGASRETITVSSGKRFIEQLGDEGAVVLRFESSQLQQRWKQICDAGASWDYPSYKPHVTISYDGSGLDLKIIQPYQGVLKFGPEELSEIE